MEILRPPAVALWPHSCSCLPPNHDKPQHTDKVSKLPLLGDYWEYMGLSNYCRVLWLQAGVDFPVLLLPLNKYGCIDAIARSLRSTRASMPHAELEQQPLQAPTQTR